MGDGMDHIRELKDRVLKKIPKNLHKEVLKVLDQTKKEFQNVDV